MQEYAFSQRSLGQILEDKAATCGNKLFLQYEEEQAVNFSEVNSMANRVANGLKELHLQPGDKIATFMPNCLEFVYSWFGISKAGMIDVPINLANKGDFLAYIINNSDAKAIIIDQSLLERLKFIQDGLPQLKQVVILSKDNSNEDLPPLKFEVVGFKDLVGSPDTAPGVMVQGSDAEMILYTSGTTGPAKGSLQTYSGLYLGCREFSKAIRTTQDDIFFTCLPLFHGNARVLTIYPALVLGTKAVIYPRFSASRFWDWIRAAKATTFNSLGAMAHFIYSQPRQANDRDNPVRVCAAFPMPVPIYADFERRYNLKVVEGYGLSEMGNIAYNPYDAPKPGSCGRETSNFEVRIVDDDDFPVPAGTVGEIVARGRQPWSMSLGYYNMPDKTVEFVRNHFYHTGDLGYLDEDGYLFFVDRKKDYIRRRGENISSFDVERSVNSHPKVGESAAIGVKSEHSEDEVKIVVVLKEGQKMTPQELLDYCQERMPYFAVPRYVEFVSSLPKTPTDRVQKNLLRGAGITPDTWDREKAGYEVKK